MILASSSPKRLADALRFGVPGLAGTTRNRRVFEMEVLLLHDESLEKLLRIRRGYKVTSESPLCGDGQSSGEGDNPMRWVTTKPNYGQGTRLAEPADSESTARWIATTQWQQDNLYLSHIDEGQ
jgi:hypothetical protein